MRMKLVSCAICTAIGLAYGAVASTVNYAVAPPGTDNIAFGYGCGYQSSGNNTNIVVIGTDAGMRTANNRDCVFIGSNAGTNLTGQTGAVVIGDVFVHTNGITTIKGWHDNFVSNEVCNIVTNSYTAFTDWTLGTFRNEDETYNLSITIKSVNYDTIFDSWMVYGDYNHVNKGTGEIIVGQWQSVLLGNANSTALSGTAHGCQWMTFRKNMERTNLGIATERNVPDIVGASFYFNGSSMVVYTNGVFAGTLTFTPAQ